MTDYFSRAAGTDVFDGPQGPNVEPVVDYFSKAAGTDVLAPQDEKPAEGRGFFGTIKDMVVGKQDPKYADVGTVYDQFPTDLHNPTANAAIFGASDPQMGDVVQKALGDKFVRREPDANGYDVFVTRGPDGQEQKGYLNAPGLDRQDIARGIRGALPYSIAGGAAYGVTGAMPLVAQAIGQGVAAGATSLGGDVALQGQGSQQGVELEKAGINAAAGIAGPFIGRGVDKLLTGRRAAGMVDPATGGLAGEGSEAATRAGVDPSAMDPEAAKTFAKTYAMTGDSAEAATRSASQPFGIPATRGQVTKRPDLLTQEEAMRRNLYGDQARETMTAFDKEQATAVKNAALGPKIAGKIAPNRAPAERSFDSNPATLGSSIREGLDSAKQGAAEGSKKAWADVPQMKATSEALDMLPSVVQKRLEQAGGVIIDENTPQALKMDGAMGAFMRGETPQAATQVAKNAAIQDVDRMRRRLLDMSRAQTTPEDERAAGAMYDAFNDWIDEAAAKNLLNGDVEVAAKLKIARGYTREMKQAFEPRDARGQLTSGGQRLAKMLDTGRADSPEGLVDSLLSSQGSKTVNQGTVDALRHVQQVLGRYADPEVGKNAWNDIRLAYWVRNVQGRNGELLGPQAMLNNLKTAFASQRSVISTLYTPQEQAQMMAFQRALETVAYKPPNASGSAYAGAQLMKQFVTKLADAFGLNSVLGRTALEYTGLGSRYGKSLARSAVDQSTKLKPNFSPSIPIFTGTVGGYGRAQQD